MIIKVRVVLSTKEVSVAVRVVGCSGGQVGQNAQRGEGVSGGRMVRKRMVRG